MSETLLQAAAAALKAAAGAATAAGGCLRRGVFIPVPKPECYSLRQTRRRERGGSREEREGGSREEEAREQRGTAGACRGAGEAPGERGAKQRERC